MVKRYEQKEKNHMIISVFRETDRGILRDITAVCYDGVSIDQNIEKFYGVIAGKNWVFRKQRHLEEDICAYPEGIFVAEIDNKAVGYISSRVDSETRIGRIVNFAVLPAHQKKGIGKVLMDRAMKHLRSEGMEYVRIETLEQNAVGKHFYPELGFCEVASQIHYIKRIDGA
jgi:ribosomal protein S18 acetylase RimI-like enzyme